ncbi:hypothetical protein pb186bvf_002732 [Paramecium bursaria]
MYYSLIDYQSNLSYVNSLNCLHGFEQILLLWVNSNQICLLIKALFILQKFHERQEFLLISVATLFNNCQVYQRVFKVQDQIRLIMILIMSFLYSLRLLLNLLQIMCGKGKFSGKCLKVSIEWLTL